MKGFQYNQKTSLPENVWFLFLIDYLKKNVNQGSRTYYKNEVQ